MNATNTTFYPKQSDITFEIIKSAFNKEALKRGIPAWNIPITFIPDNPNSTLPLLRADVYDAGKDTTKAACVMIPGYVLGFWDTETGENNGWNNGGGPTADSSRVQKSIGGGYESSSIIVISYNSHEDYNGERMSDGNFGIIWDSGPSSEKPGALDKALELLRNRIGVELDSCRIVSHSTGHYIAKKILDKINVKEYWALSPNTRGSTLIGAWPFPQNYDSYEDMLRHKYQVNDTSQISYNTCIVELSGLGLKSDSTKVNIMLSHGDAQTGGEKGILNTFTNNVGVVSYSNVQESPTIYEQDRRRKYLKYEALSNLSEFELNNSSNYRITMWDNRQGLLTGYPTEDLLEHLKLEERLEVVAEGNTKLGAIDPAQIFYKGYDTTGKNGIWIEWKGEWMEI